MRALAPRLLSIFALRMKGGMMFQSLGLREVGAEDFPQGFFLPSLFQVRAFPESADEFDEVFHEVLSDVARECGKTVHRIEEEAAELLEGYDWYDDFSKLRSVLRSAVRKMRKNVLRAQDLPLSFVMEVYSIQESS